MWIVTDSMLQLLTDVSGQLIGLIFNGQSLNINYRTNNLGTKISVSLPEFNWNSLMWKVLKRLPPNIQFHENICSVSRIKFEMTGIAKL
jgi:hypothetical protein